jgi:hypothetical protein
MEKSHIIFHRTSDNSDNRNLNIILFIYSKRFDAKVPKDQNSKLSFAPRLTPRDIHLHFWHSILSFISPTHDLLNPLTQKNLQESLSIWYGTETIWNVSLAMTFCVVLMLSLEEKVIKCKRMLRMSKAFDLSLSIGVFVSEVFVQKFKKINCKNKI